MGFIESWKPFFGFSTGPKNNNRPSFDLNDRHNTTKLKAAAKNLSQLDRRKFLGMIKEEGLLSKEVSNRQLVAIMKRRGEQKRFVDRIKAQALTPQGRPIRNEKQIAKNIRLTTFERIQDEAKFGEEKLYNTGLAGNYNQGKNISPTAIRPGATRSSSQDQRVEGPKDIHLPV